MHPLILPNSLTSEWETSLLAIYCESGDSWNPAPGNKLYEKESVLCRKMEEGKADYEASIDHTNALQLEILTVQLPEVEDHNYAAF